MEKRMYIRWSSMWDTGPDYYPKHLIKAAVKEAGGKNVRLARLYGWSNQPQVVTFDVPKSVSLDRILDRVKFVCNKPWRPIASEKDWR